MKRIGRILIAIMLVVPMLFGISFFANDFSLNAPQTAQNGGGGANSLDSPKTGNNSDFESDKNAKDTQVWAEPIIKTYQDYFVDFFNLPTEIYSVQDGVTTIDYAKIGNARNGNDFLLKYNGTTFCTITQDDLSGKGTLSEPYVIKNLKGYLYLFNGSICRISLTNKYVELDCDIFLNDEKFDKDGNVIGGDGIVYCLRQGLSDYTREMFFDGKGHTISGMFYDKETADYVGMFGYQKQNLIENLTVANYFLRGKDTVATFGYSCVSVKNVTTLNGFIYGNSLCSGIVSTSREIVDTKNYCDVFAYDRVAGGFLASWASTSYTRLENCENYGHVETPHYCAGIVATPSAHMEIIRCKNFGTIKGGTCVAGIVSADYYIGAKKISYCENYGDLHFSGQACGGIIGWITQKTEVSNCRQYGRLFEEGNAWYNGSIVGQVSQGGDAIVKDCVVEYYGEVNAVIVGRIIDSKIEISNISITKHNLRDTTIELFTDITNSSCLLSKVEVIAKSDNKVPFYACHYYGGENELVLENIFVNIDNVTNTNITNKTSESAKVKIKSLIINNQFYGSDFSGYYVDWKTGKVGVKAVSGKGFYQGKVTTQWLLNNGYQQGVI